MTHSFPTRRSSDLGALHFGEALPENIAKQLGEPLAEQAVQAELQEDRQLEQDDAGDQQGLEAPRQVGGKRPDEAEVRVKDADESEPPGLAVRLDRKSPPLHSSQ